MSHGRQNKIAITLQGSQPISSDCQPLSVFLRKLVSYQTKQGNSCCTVVIRCSRLYHSALSGQCLFCCRGGVIEETFLWSGDRANWLPRPRSLLGYFRSQSKQVSAGETAGTDDRALQSACQLYSDQSGFNEIFTESSQIVAHTPPDECVYLSSLLSFNCCRKINTGKHQHNRRPDWQRHSAWIHEALPRTSHHSLLITRFSQYYENKMCYRVPNDAVKVRGKIKMEDNPCTSAGPGSLTELDLFVSQPLVHAPTLHDQQINRFDLIFLSQDKVIIWRLQINWQTCISPRLEHSCFKVSEL